MLNRLVLAMLLPATVLGQIRHDSAKPVDANDAVYPLLVQHQKQIAQAYERGGGKIVPRFSKWVLVESDAAKQLFPDVRFASLEWDEEMHPKAGNELMGLAAMLQVTLAVDLKANTVIATLSGHGNYEDYGKLLVDRKITLKNEADAKAIWSAFCDIHHKHWKAQPHKQHSETEWRLGYSSYDQSIGSGTVVTQTHFKRVRVDAKTGRVLAWESVVESSNQRQAPPPSE